MVVFVGRGARLWHLAATQPWPTPPSDPRIPPFYARGKIVLPLLSPATIAQHDVVFFFPSQNRQDYDGFPYETDQELVPFRPGGGHGHVLQNNLFSCSPELIFFGNWTVAQGYAAVQLAIR